MQGEVDHSVSALETVSGHELTNFNMKERKKDIERKRNSLHRMLSVSDSATYTQMRMQRITVDLSDFLRCRQTISVCR